MTPLRHPLQLLLRKLATHAPLEHGDRDAILALPHSLRTIEPLGYIVREGEAPRHCGVIVSGFAFRQKLTGDGARQIVSLHIPGEPVDFQNLYLDESDHNVQALTRAEVALIAQADLRALARAHPAVETAIAVMNLIES